MKKDYCISVIGGGTGTYSILSGLKSYTSNLKAIVTMADSGGVARKERDEWGLLPSSDIRKSLLALADVSSDDTLLLRKLFQYRYSEGNGLEGVSFGNLFLIALTKLLGSQAQAISKAGEILKIRGQVLPVSYDKVDLVAYYEDGSKVVGEHFIDEPKHNGTLKIVKITCQPMVQASPEVIDAIKKSNAIIIGPGGFYTTILANLVISGIVNAIKSSKAKKIFIMNLMTEYGQTYQFTANTFLTELDKYLPSKFLNYVLINNAQIPDNILKKYKAVNAMPVVDDLKNNYNYKIIRSDLLNPHLVTKQIGDKLNRSLVRHSPEKLAKTCLKILNLI
jgi:uncharacterized cofD-like protein